MTVVQGQTSKLIRYWVNDQADSPGSQRKLQEAGIFKFKTKKVNKDQGSPGNAKLELDLSIAGLRQV